MPTGERPPGPKRRRGRDEAQAAFEQFVDDVAGDLVRTGYLVVWDLALAEDLAQECLLKIARRWPRVRSMEHPKAYARRILVNLALDERRRASRHRAELGGEDRERHDHAAECVLERVDDAFALLEAMRQLTARQRAFLALRYFDDLSEAEVAEIMGCSIGTVKSTVARALERLRVSEALTAPATGTSDVIRALDTKGA